MGIRTEKVLFADPDEIFDDVQPVLGRKWHLRIVYQLLENGAMGFSALKRKMTGVSSKMLSESLDSLEDERIVERSVVSEQPVRVEYDLTERGRALEQVVTAVMNWGYEFDFGDGDS
ncbi:winged helix-turn-helix transcriptional regulator [Halovenus salina]|uniref:winged helix-turn-helix transcriptional regulator n=1 Tax=Halovenus salina TaxID=1510225 RepID=UPI0034A26340